MCRLIILLALLVSFSPLAIDGCSECHEEKWKETPAHIWIETQHHIEAVSCMDCHRWKDGDDLPPVLPSQANLNRDCGICHKAPQTLAEKMHMTQYKQL